MAEFQELPKEGVRYLGHFWIGQPTGDSAYIAFKVLGLGDLWVTGQFDTPPGGSPLDTLRHHFQGLYPTPQIHGEHVLTGAFQVVVEGEGRQRENRLVQGW